MLEASKTSLMIERSENISIPEINKRNLKELDKNCFKASNDSALVTKHKALIGLKRRRNITYILESGKRERK